MNRYPLWKYIWSSRRDGRRRSLYALPNFFGESRRCRSPSARATVKVDTALLGRVEEALRCRNIAYTAFVLDATSLRVRFADTDTQLKARDVIQALNPGRDYVVALNLLPASPAWLPRSVRCRCTSASTCAAACTSCCRST
jgi:preprotein translocase subunit SecD